VFALENVSRRVLVVITQRL